MRRLTPRVGSDKGARAKRYPLLKSVPIPKSVPLSLSLVVGRGSYQVVEKKLITHRKLAMVGIKRIAVIKLMASRGLTVR